MTTHNSNSGSASQTVVRNGNSLSISGVITAKEIREATNLKVRVRFDQSQGKFKSKPSLKWTPEYPSSLNVDLAVDEMVPSIDSVLFVFNSGEWLNCDQFNISWTAYGEFEDCAK